MIDPKRREVFTSLSRVAKGTKKVPFAARPPYNKEPSLFLTLCIACESKACAKACEEGIILMREDGTPELDFSKRGCTFCEACALACPEGVLSDTSLQYIPASVEIDVLKCIAWHNVICTACKDPCLEDAIDFLGLFRPTIDHNRCTGCGFCSPVCPSDAIVFKPKERGNNA